MDHAISLIEKALHKGDFTKAEDLLKRFKGSIDDLNIKNKTAAEYVGELIKTYLPHFSIIKSPLITSISNFLDKAQVKKLLVFSPDINSIDSATKLKALDCYLDNKSYKKFDNDHQCLKKVLGPADKPAHSDTLSVLAAHTKCEPGVPCIKLKEYFTILYNLHPVVAKVMDVSAKACKKDSCNIVFTYDANYSTKDGNSPNVVTKGYYNGHADVFISADNDPSAYYGTFIHELTHYSMNSLYKHDSNPYPDALSKMYQHLYPKGGKYVSKEGDFKQAANAIEVLLKSKVPQNYEQTNVQSTINGLKKWYQPADYDTELVVRYPHMIASNTPESDVDYYLQPLEDYFYSHIIPDMNNYLVA